MKLKLKNSPLTNPIANKHPPRLLRLTIRTVIQTPTRYRHNLNQLVLPYLGQRQISSRTLFPLAVPLCTDIRQFIPFQRLLNHLNNPVNLLYSNDTRYLSIRLV